MSKIEKAVVKVVKQIKETTPAVTKISDIESNIKANKISSKLSLGLKISGGIIAAGTVVDTATHISENREVKKQKKADLKALKKQKKEELKRTRPQNNIFQQLGSLPFEMYEDRIGHTNMGNAKFN